MTEQEQSRGSSTKISTDTIKTFRGDGDICAWLKKIEIVCRLTGQKDEALFIPLYLDGGALAVYMQMEEAEQEDDISSIYIISPDRVLNKIVYKTYNKRRCLKVLRTTSSSQDQDIPILYAYPVSLPAVHSYIICLQ